MVSFKEIIITFLLAGLFTFCLISWGIQTANENGVNGINSSSYIQTTYFNLSSKMPGADYANTSATNFQKDKLTTGAGYIVFESIVGIGNSIWNTGITMYNILIVLPEQFLGIPPIVTGILAVIITFLMILGLWRLYRLG